MFSLNFLLTMTFRRGIILLFLLNFIMLFFFLFLSLNDHSISISHSPTSKREKIHLLIVSSWRSGSSFLGQIFNQHNDVFYLYEPGHPIWMRLKQESAELLQYTVRDLLRSLFNCNVSPLHPYLPSRVQRISHIDFFSESRALCSPPACSSLIHLESYDQTTCYHRCGNASLDRMEESCRSYSHVVIKTVRVFDFSVLLPLLQDPTLNLKILHLVRDPRAVAASRKKGKYYLSIDDNIVIKDGMDGKKLSQDQVMMKICKSQVAIYKEAKSSGMFSRGRYMLIRHEDLAMEPLANAKRLLKYAGLHLTSDLEKWIYNVTHHDIKQLNDFLSFSREAAKVIQKWRGELDFKMVKNIEKYCKGAMKAFGYLPLNSEKEMKNLTLNLITNIKEEPL
ncbi:carbohydrate sulfotransferase 5-like [Pelobates cultripes]|uniref:Sulfotransferase n=1 Tax=Pelobates cultripes TaxID=61616 RepID=A0AAD1WJX6_PELCU|nr:carbohydrate sulfotransferase 5-like [Pelobates cultripes]